MSDSIKFVKMQGLGNDFVLVEGSEISKYDMEYSEISQKICDRHFGVGADGLIVVNPPEIKAKTDTSWKIFNSDGTEPQMCGNGIRCFAKYVYDKKIVKKKKFTVSTLAGTIVPEIQDNGEVKVDMGEPIFETEKIPVCGIKSKTVINQPIEIKNKKFNFTAVSMGNPHCIIFTDEDGSALAQSLGPEIEKYKLFPEKTNVEFVKILTRNNIKIDVWERGCGITLACGTGACASVVAGIVNNLLDNTVIANLPGGKLEIQWKSDKSTNNVFMTGPAEYVFYGEYLLTK